MKTLRSLVRQVLISGPHSSSWTRSLSQLDLMDFTSSLSGQRRSIIVSFRTLTWLRSGRTPSFLWLQQLVRWCRVNAADTSWRWLGTSQLKDIFLEGTSTSPAWSRKGVWTDGTTAKRSTTPTLSLRSVKSGWIICWCNVEKCLIPLYLQWDLVCSNQWKVPFASSTLFVGYLFGSLISGQFSDRYFIIVHAICISS